MPKSNDKIETTSPGFSWQSALERISFTQVALLTLATMLMALLFWQAWELRFILFALLSALMLHTGMKPAVDTLEKRGVRRRIGVSIVYLLLLIVVVSILIVLVPMVSSQIGTLMARIPEYYDLVRDFLLQSGIEFLTRMARLLPPPTNMEEVQAVVLESAAAPAAPTGSFLRTIGGVAQSIFTVLSVFAIAFYLTIDRDRILQSFLLRMAPTPRTEVRSLVDEIEHKVGAFIRGQLILCTVIGLFSFVAYLLIGLPYAPALGALAFIFEAVPMVGPLLSAIPAVLVAATIGPDKLIWVIVAVTVIQVAENNILVPRVMDRAVGVSAIVSLLAILAFSYLFGILGAVLAIPLAATIQVLMDRYLWSEPDDVSNEAEILDGSEASRGPLDIVRLQAVDLAQDVRKQFRASSEISEENDPDVDAIEDSIEMAAMEMYELLGTQSAAVTRPTLEGRAS